MSTGREGDGVYTGREGDGVYRARVLDAGDVKLYFLVI